MTAIGIVSISPVKKVGDITVTEITYYAGPCHLLPSAVMQYRV